MTTANLITCVAFLFKIFSLKWHEEIEDRGVEQGEIKWMFAGVEANSPIRRNDGHQPNDGHQQNDGRVDKIANLQKQVELLTRLVQRMIPPTEVDHKLEDSILSLRILLMQYSLADLMLISST